MDVTHEGISAAHVAKRIALLDAIDMAASAWRSVEKDTFEQCLHKAFS